MPALTDEDKAALANLSDEEKLLLAQFETSEGGEGEADEGPNEPPEGGEQGAPSGEQEHQETEGGEAEEGDEVEISSVRIGNRDVPVEDIQALLEFQAWSQQNPDKMKAFGQYLQGEAEFVVKQQQQQEQEQPQIDWDLIDPQFKAVYEAQQKQLEELAAAVQQQQAPVQQWQQKQIEDAIRQADEQIAKATSQITEKFSLDLTPEEIEDLHNSTAALNILPGLREAIADPVEATATALEMAIFRTPKFREKIIGQQVASERAKDKRHLASTVSGTSGSDRSGLESPSEGEVRKMSPEDRNKAMAAEIAEHLRGTA